MQLAFGYCTEMITRRALKGGGWDVCAWGGGVQDVRGTRRGGYNMINMESFSIYFCFRSNSSISVF